MAAAGTSREDVSFYRAFGAVKVRGVISRGAAERFRAEAMKLLNAGPVSELDISGVNEQRPQVWKSNPTLRALTMHLRIGAAAQQLAGVPLRLWHDDIIAKPPKNEGPRVRTRTCRCGRWARPGTRSAPGWRCRTLRWRWAA